MAFHNPLMRAFSPRQLFGAGEQGVWYDPSDMTTLFQNSTGTTPVTAVEQPVGLVLDKSKGLTLGSELVTNGDFSNGTTGWTLVDVGSGATFGVSSGQLTITGGSNAARAVQGVTTVSGGWYKLTSTLISTTGSCIIRATSNSDGSAATGFPSTTVSAAGTYTLYFQATGTTTYIVGGTVSGASVLTTIDNVTVKALPGNHATQSTDASRPVLSARYNLLTKTEQFDDADWTKFRCTITANDQTAPDGTTTGDKVNCNTTNANGFTVYSASSTIIPSGGEVLVVAYGKKGSRNQFRLGAANDTQSNGVWAAFNLNDGTYVSSSSYGSGWSVVGTPTITSVANGWYLMSMKVQAGATALCKLDFYPSITSTSDYSCTSGVDYGYIWGADLRVSNDGVGLPAYQRVNTSTDYDTNGFPRYLRFDGTDDWLVTGSINFTSTDEMTVFAGVRKLSDAAIGVIAELSAARGSNNGAFTLFAPQTAGVGNYSFLSRGTIDPFNTPATTFSAPITNVLAGSGDISADIELLRVNTVQFTISPDDQGSGNYGNYPLYIGRRGGTTLPYNGRLYNLLVLGKAATAGQISDTESWVNSRTRAY